MSEGKKIAGDEASALDAFLRSLLATKRGRAISANLWRGVLIAEDVSPRLTCQLLRACASKFNTGRALPPGDRGKDALEVFESETRALLKRIGKNWVKIDQPAPALHFALLAHGGNLLPKWQSDGIYPRHVVISNEGLRDVIGMSPSQAEAVPLEPALIDLVRLAVRKHRREDAKLGDGLEYVVWLTPADDDWMDALDECEVAQCADPIYDRLGLPRVATEIALMLRVDAQLFAEKPGWVIAAPTILEGYRHPFFRQVENRRKHQGFGQTLHLGDLRLRAPTVGGAPEAVLPELSPWEPDLNAEVVWVLQANASRAPTEADCADHLWAGLDEDQVCRELVDLVAKVQP